MVAQEGLEQSAVERAGAGSTAGRTQGYDAFISYSHADRRLAAGIQKALHRIGRRMGQLAALRVFRDATDLTATPDLWGRVCEAMDRSRFFIVVLSPRSAGSAWVDKEVAYWLERNGPDRLQLVVADGDLAWDEEAGRFDPDDSTVAVPVLTQPGALPSEPLYVDVTGDEPWDAHSPVFREKVTDLAAPIHGKPKYELASEDVREQRRFRRWRSAAVVGLVMLTVAAVVAAGIAVTQRDEAARQRNEAVALALAASSRGEAESNPALALALGAESYGATPTPLLQATSALVRARIGFSERTAQPVGDPLTGHTDGVVSVAFSPDGTQLASAGWDGTVRLWDPATGEPVGDPLTGHTGWVEAVAFSPDGTLLASAGVHGTVRLWDPATGKPVGDPLTGHTDSVTAVAFSPDGTLAGLRELGRHGAAMGPGHRETGGRPADRPHRHCGGGGVQPRRVPAGLRRQGRHGAAMGPDHQETGGRPADRPHRHCGGGGIQPRRVPAGLRRQGRHGAVVGPGHRETGG